jgi:hypothetical protein
MQSLMDPTKGLKVTALEGDAFAAAMGRLFGFAYVWSLGGNLAPTCTEAFDEFVREHLQDAVTFPGTAPTCQLIAANVTREFDLDRCRDWHGSNAMLYDRQHARMCTPCLLEVSRQCAPYTLLLLLQVVAWCSTISCTSSQACRSSSPGPTLCQVSHTASQCHTSR